MSDWKADTRDHIAKVGHHISRCIEELEDRAAFHDAEKLIDPEASIFAEYTDKLRDCTYMSDEYKEFLKGMKPALDHHYAAYRHHPEHFENGIKDMNLIDLLEMLCDWKASTERHADGDVRKSIVINQDRFGYSDDVKGILLNTVDFLESWL